MSEPIPKKYPKKRAGTKKRNRERRAEGRTMRSERRGSLREAAIERAGSVCEWASCDDRWAHMAHIEGIGRGGDPRGERDSLENVAMLCVYHHDLLDGRTQSFRLREIEALLSELIKLRGAV